MVAQNKNGKKSFFKGIKAEMKKISWPTKKELINHTTVVLVACAIMSGIFFVFDKGCESLIQLIIK
ncbi:preprotein translocase subunit SecE [Clostridiaceae bacterium M8S5]|nr:preprotein translocase subunit SecE [Clostridiaceae bacterium M8S5]